jgi:hypothetical protein
MNRISVVTGLAALGLLLGVPGFAEAGRVPVTRTEAYRNNGTRLDLTVPYLTTGRSAFMSGYVQPRIYSSPILDDPRYPGVKPVFNLIFYGAKQSFGDRSNGATPRTR